MSDTSSYEWGTTDGTFGPQESVMYSDISEDGSNYIHVDWTIRNAAPVADIALKQLSTPGPLSKNKAENNDPLSAFKTLSVRRTRKVCHLTADLTEDPRR